MKPVEQTITLTKADLAELIQLAIREAKAPSDEEKAAAEVKKNRRDKAILQSAEDARLKMEAKKMLQQQCAHLKPNGKAQTVTVLFSDGFVRKLCLGCQSFLQEYEAPMSVLQSGVPSGTWEEFTAVPSGFINPNVDVPTQV